MQIVVTGGTGFIGRSLCLRLAELGHADIRCLTRSSPPDDWTSALAAADVVFHLAGVNRPVDAAEFDIGNADLTATVCGRLAVAQRGATLVLASSTQSLLDNPYGRSKRAAERAVVQYGEATGARACILRLPNVFGKWARPNYNSVVATFCHNLIHGVPIVVHDEGKVLNLAYVDDVLDVALSLLPPAHHSGPISVAPVYQATVGEIAEILRSFAESRVTRAMPPVGAGLARALYSTYVSYLAPAAFAYALAPHDDARGTFAEILRTSNTGQFSYFTARPGAVRGGHYHHTKTEKFVVVQGAARFDFRHVVTGEVHEIDVDGRVPTVVESVPGWAHSIANTGDTELVVFLWANEVFEANRPDTISAGVAL